MAQDDGYKSIPEISIQEGNVSAGSGSEASGSEVAVLVSEDGLTASIQCMIPESAPLMTRDMITKLLQEKNVNFGINDANIDLFVSSPLSYVDQPLVIAEGQPPIHGKDGKIEHLFDSKDNQPRPLELEDGKVDYRELIRINNVVEGEIIAEMIPPTQGIPGTKVTGEIITCKDGKEVKFKLGKNVRIDPDETKVYAETLGMVSITDNGKINVFPVYEVKGDLDYHVGNVDFVGNVIIRGNVLSGFKIKSAGDVLVTGGVESAEIEASGSIEIASGIYGAMKGFVKAGVDVKCSFMQEANVTAGNNIEVTKSILHCNAHAGNSIVCEGKKGKGLIVGGVVEAGGLILAKTVGNSSSTPTFLKVGAPPKLRLELEELHVKVTSLEETLDKTEKALKFLEQKAMQAPLVPGQIQLQINLIETKKSLTSQRVDAKARIEEIEADLVHIEDARIKIVGTLYPGVKIIVGISKYVIKNSFEGITFLMRDGKVMTLSN